ncbi:MAG: hypothetical protein H7235_02270 [Bdellovibrionaceae bacterium]|nr:hypothetical protein [Pseudobdellovibrionaceae bacterium]
MASTFEFLKHPLKLISSLLEAPPNIVVDLNKVSNSPAVVLNQLSRPEGICGWIPSEVGSADWVCQAFGTVMPGIVFLVSFFVFVVTLTFLIWYFQRYLKFKKEMKKLLHYLSTSSESAESVIANLRQSGEKLPPLLHFAHRLSDSLLSFENGTAVLKKPVTTIADESNQLDSWTGKRLADEIPSWLTTLGLLTTFLAILLGLQHVKVLTNLDVQGIGGLVNGLSGKFFSSIVALACALSVTIINYFLTEKIENVWRGVLYKLELLLPHLSTEQILLDLVKEQKRKKTEM